MEAFEHWTSLLSLIVFVALIIAETVFSRARRLDLFESKDTVVNLVLGVITFVTKVGSKAAILYVYTKLFDLAPWHLPENSVLWFIACLLANDFLFYWYHRLCHTTRIFWAVHVAHHSSEKMNISTAVRGNFMNNLFHAIFWIPLLFLGFPPAIVIMTDAASYLYQLWLHTRIIPKLGPLEWIFNTPSHHRVHHGSNPQYIDKNYAAIFIFWDRLFGSFEEEHEAVRYGITKPLKTHNPLKVAFHEFESVFADVARKRTWLERIQELFRKP